MVPFLCLLQGGGAEDRRRTLTPLSLRYSILSESRLGRSPLPSTLYAFSYKNANVFPSRQSTRDFLVKDSVLVSVHLIFSAAGRVLPLGLYLTV